MNFTRRFITPNWEQHRCPSAGRWAKPVVVDPCSGILHSDSQSGHAIHAGPEALWSVEEADTKGIGYDSTHVAFEKRPNCRKKMKKQKPEAGCEEGHEGLFDMTGMSSIVTVAGGSQTTHQSDSWAVDLKRMNFKE